MSRTQDGFNIQHCCIPKIAMNEPYYIACSNSKMDADITMIRLRRVGIGTEKISVLFPRHQMPNAVVSWMSLPEDLGLCIGQDPLMAAGRLRDSLASAPSGGSLTQLLEGAGFPFDLARDIEMSLEFGRILIFVHDLTDRELALAWHVFTEFSVDVLAMGSESRRRVAEALRVELQLVGTA